MGIEKTSSVILSILPYRESSCIITLFTSDHGRVSGIAKGVRRNSKQTLPLERGFLIEHVVYFKSGRELQTLGDIRIDNYFPSVRGNLEKTTLRDIAFELLLLSITQSDPNPELFSLLTSFLDNLENSGSRGESFSVLWRFVFDFMVLMGFGVGFDKCTRCGEERIREEGGYLLVEKGTMICGRCAPDYSLSKSNWMPGSTASYLLRNGSSAGKFDYSTENLIRLSVLAVDYCRFHLDIRRELKAVGFLREMLEF